MESPRGRERARQEIQATSRNPLGADPFYYGPYPHQEPWHAVASRASRERERGHVMTLQQQQAPWHALSRAREEQERGQAMTYTYTQQQEPDHYYYYTYDPPPPAAGLPPPAAPPPPPTPVQQLPPPVPVREQEPEKEEAVHYCGCSFEDPEEEEDRRHWVLYAAIALLSFVLAAVAAFALYRTRFLERVAPLFLGSALFLAASFGALLRLPAADVKVNPSFRDGCCCYEHGRRRCEAECKCRCHYEDEETKLDPDDDVCHKCNGVKGAMLKAESESFGAAGREATYHACLILGLLMACFGLTELLSASLGREAGLNQFLSSNRRYDIAYNGDDASRGKNELATGMLAFGGAQLFIALLTCGLTRRYNSRWLGLAVSTLSLVVCCGCVASASWNQALHGGDIDGAPRKWLFELAVVASLLLCLSGLLLSQHRFVACFTLVLWCCLIIAVAVSQTRAITVVGRDCESVLLYSGERWWRRSLSCAKYREAGGLRWEDSQYVESRAGERFSFDEDVVFAWEYNTYGRVSLGPSGTTVAFYGCLNDQCCGMLKAAMRYNRALMCTISAAAMAVLLLLICKRPVLKEKRRKKRSFFYFMSVVLLLGGFGLAPQFFYKRQPQATSEAHVTGNLAESSSSTIDAPLRALLPATALIKPTDLILTLERTSVFETDDYDDPYETDAPTQVPTAASLVGANLVLEGVTLEVAQDSAASIQAAIASSADVQPDQVVITSFTSLARRRRLLAGEQFRVDYYIVAGPRLAAEEVATRLASLTVAGLGAALVESEAPSGLSLVSLNSTAIFEATAEPTPNPTRTRAPSSSPTRTDPPTSGPTSVPTAPTLRPTEEPTPEPTQSPAPTRTDEPTFTPTTGEPTSKPTSGPTSAPSELPTSSPTSSEPTTSMPSMGPTDFMPTYAPSEAPTSVPSYAPSNVPTAVPSAVPTSVPSNVPSAVPTVAPTAVPTLGPTAEPTLNPTVSSVPTVTFTPTYAPSYFPTAAPTSGPTAAPSPAPSTTPTAAPTSGPTAAPTAGPSPAPSATPTATARRLDETCQVDLQQHLAARDVAWTSGNCKRYVNALDLGVLNEAACNLTLRIEIYGDAEMRLQSGVVRESGVVRADIDEMRSILSDFEICPTASCTFTSSLTFFLSSSCCDVVSAHAEFEIEHATALTERRRGRVTRLNCLSGECGVSGVQVATSCHVTETDCDGFYNLELPYSAEQHGSLQTLTFTKDAYYDASASFILGALVAENDADRYTFNGTCIDKAANKQVAPELCSSKEVCKAVVGPSSFCECYGSLLMGRCARSAGLCEEQDSPMCAEGGVPCFCGLAASPIRLLGDVLIAPVAADSPIGCGETPRPSKSPTAKPTLDSTLAFLTYAPTSLPTYRPTSEQIFDDDTPRPTDGGDTPTGASYAPSELPTYAPTPSLILFDDDPSAAPTAPSAQPAPRPTFPQAVDYTLQGVAVRLGGGEVEGTALLLEAQLEPSSTVVATRALNSNGEFIFLGPSEPTLAFVAAVGDDYGRLKKQGSSFSTIVPLAPVLEEGELGVALVWGASELDLVATFNAGGEEQDSNVLEGFRSTRCLVDDRQKKCAGVEHVSRTKHVFDDGSVVQTSFLTIAPRSTDYTLWVRSRNAEEQATILVYDHEGLVGSYDINVTQQAEYTRTICLDFTTSPAASSRVWERQRQFSALGWASAQLIDSCVRPDECDDDSGRWRCSSALPNAVYSCYDPNDLVFCDEGEMCYDNIPLGDEERSSELVRQTMCQ